MDDKDNQTEVAESLQEAAPASSDNDEMVVTLPDGERVELDESTRETK